MTLEGDATPSLKRKKSRSSAHAEEDISSKTATTGYELPKKEKEKRRKSSSFKTSHAPRSSPPPALLTTGHGNLDPAVIEEGEGEGGTVKRKRKKSLKGKSREIVDEESASEQEAESRVNALTRQDTPAPNFDDLDFDLDDLEVDSNDLDAEFVPLEKVREEQGKFSRQAAEERKKGRAAAITEAWVNVDGPARLFYDDYMEPFHPIESQAGNLISKKYQVLARAWGRVLNPAKIKVIKLAADHILEDATTEIIHISTQSSWVLLNLQTVKARETLLKRGAIMNRAEKTMIFFRPFLKCPGRVRLVQVLRVPGGKDAEEAVQSAAKKKWPDTRVKVMRKPAVDGVDSTQVYVYIMMASLANAKGFVGKGQLEVEYEGKVLHWETTKAPTCQFCGGNDHEHAQCTWTDRAKNQNVILNARLGEKKGAEVGSTSKNRPALAPKAVAKGREAKPPKADRLAPGSGSTRDPPSHPAPSSTKLVPNPPPPPNPPEIKIIMTDPSTLQTDEDDEEDEYRDMDSADGMEEDV